MMPLLKLSMQLYFVCCLTAPTFFLTFFSLMLNAYNKSSRKLSEVTSALVRLAGIQTQKLQLAENLAVRQW